MLSCVLLCLKKKLIKKKMESSSSKRCLEQDDEEFTFVNQIFQKRIKLEKNRKAENNPELEKEELVS